ncbi:hypothetical protein F441_01755 [Phytophthora nicotianae CJ01A1]|uniref:Uncharacterized protein n=1 Tax=Phytophthora nicotianae CJ01A1 TaxID=1317063 RepID=W2XSJ0_PHYNI|nr:hypothetical protein F441_01755 [Phytophthora nicotianae CJ01A1]
MATKRPRLDAEDDPGPNSQVKNSKISYWSSNNRPQRQSDDVKMWMHDVQQTLTKT